MWHTRPSLLLALLGMRVTTGEIVYITDLPIWSSLADCAGRAISYQVLSQTYNNCPEPATALQSCVCKQDGNSAAIAKSISSGVIGSCGSMATEDVASAATVYTAYCNQETKFSFPTPATAVSQYITDIAEMQYLAPCAYSALSYAVMSMTYNLCPTDATALAPCVCSKNQNYLSVSSEVNTDVKYSCSSHSADITSAQAMLSAYCALNNGTSAFPSPASPPGQMTYYITGLPQFSSMARCAASGLSYAVQSQTYALCPGGPADLASCACIKTGMSSYITSLISSNVKGYCTSTASAQVSSALDIFAFYCSAALGQVTPTDVTESIAQSTPTGNPTGAGGVGSGGGGGTKNGGGTKSTSSPSGGGGGDSGINGLSSGPKAGVVAGAVVGGIGGLLVVGAGIFFVMRSIRKSKMAAAAVVSSRPGTAPDNTFNSRPELGGQPVMGVVPPPIRPPVSPSPSMLKASPPPRADNVSPASAHTNGFSPPPHQAELQSIESPPLPGGSAELAGYGHGQGPFQAPSPNRSELQAPGGSPYQQGPAHTNAELQGQGPMYVNRPELQGQGATYPGRPELQGQGAMYPNHPELQGQGAPYPPGRPELAGQYMYPQPQAQAQQFYAPQGQAQYQHQPPPGSSQMGWQAGPFQQQYHEMDGGYRGQNGGPGQS